MKRYLVYANGVLYPSDREDNAYGQTHTKWEAEKLASKVAKQGTRCSIFEEIARVEPSEPKWEEVK